jgi:hypothetical protein
MEAVTKSNNPDCASHSITLTRGFAQGPLKAEVLRDNPFHCTGAAEYITEEEYQSQRMSYTQLQEAALLAYMRKEGMKKFAHVLSP